MNYSKTALVTGITGQDGAYLARFLLDRDYKVFGAFRRCSTTNFWRLEQLGVREHPGFRLIELDLTDLGSCIRVMSEVQPDELYNLAAQSFVGGSFFQPMLTAQVTGLGALNLLEALRLQALDCRFYQASTSEMFGKVRAVPQDENTEFHPRSPYGVAKLYAHWITVNYRESYDIFASSGILFNHESPLRGLEFVTRKITDAVARIYHGRLECLYLGNLDARRDWGYAAEYVEGMYLMLQQDFAGTFVLATGVTHSVREFVQLAFEAAGIDLHWEGSRESEKAFRNDTGKQVVGIDPEYYRPAEVDLLIGNPGKAERELGWKSRTTMQQLCEMMVRADMERMTGASLPGMK